MKLLRWLPVVLLIFCIVPISHADTFYVWTNSPADGPGTAWSNAFRQLQDGIDAAAVGDTVLVTNGIYTSGTEFTVTNAITVQSVNGAEVTIVDGQDLRRGFNLTSSGCTIDGFTIRNGIADGTSYPRDCGGGVYCTNGFPSFVSRCVIADNLARNDGGGLHWVIADHCTLSGNYAEDSGGGARDGELSNCLLLSNSVSLSRSAYGYGGGCSGGWLTHCTLVGNQARISGGAHNSRFATNCIIYGNAASESGDNWYVIGSGGTNIYYSCTTPDPSTIGNVTEPPLFIDEAGGDYRLRGDSPCIDAGLDVGTSDDFDGNTRPLDGDFNSTPAPDMGAFEYDPNTTDTDSDGLLDTEEHTLGFDLMRNSTGAIAYGEANVTSNPKAYSLYTSNSIMNLNMGYLMLAASNGNMNLNIQLQQSPEVTGTWSDVGLQVEWSEPITTEKYFFRVMGGE